MENKKISEIYIIISGILWGTMGAFRRALGEFGLDSFGVVFIRCFFAAVLFAIAILIKDKGLFKIKLKDAWCFIGSGVFSLLFFTVCYFQAMTLMSLSAAAILLYTAPCFVMIMSAILFKEKLTKKKVLALFIALAGVMLVSGIVGSNTVISKIGLLYGLGSGIGYALYSIFGKLAINRGYGSLTINFYACLLAAIGTGILGGISGPVAVMTMSVTSFVLCIAAGLFTCFLPYLLYTLGLQKVEAGRASVIASIEPVVASIVGLVLFGETIGIWGIVGIILVLGAIVLINRK